MSALDLQAGDTVYAIVTDHPRYPKSVHAGRKPYGVHTSRADADRICAARNGYYTDTDTPQPWPFYVLEAVVLPAVDDAPDDDGPAQAGLFDGATSRTWEA